MKKQSVKKPCKEVPPVQVFIWLVLLLCIVFIGSFSFGRYPVSIRELWSVLLGKLFLLPVTWSHTLETIIIKVRLPRILAAMLVGAGLSVSGAVYQGIFKNPMISPDILGASSGAGFGAVTAILLSFNALGIQLSSFVFGMAAVLLVLAISSVIGRKNNPMLVLVLIGMVVSTLFSSLISITKFIADPYDKLPEITFWLMGGLSTVSMRDVKIIVIPIIIGMVPLMLLRWKLNVLSFGDEEAQAMGIDTSKLRVIIIVCSTFLTAASVSICGMVGWVGLVIPHLARMFVGPNYKELLPTSCLLGAIYLMIIDNLARSILSIEIPLGILTSLIGAPFFLYNLCKRRKGWL